MYPGGSQLYLIDGHEHVLSEIFSGLVISNAGGLGAALPDVTSPGEPRVWKQPPR
jgi:hypothetical protein